MGYITKVTWIEDLAFEVDVQGHKFKVDADAEFGGKDRGPKPKALVLAGLAGCTGMDVASILKKMRVDFSDFHVEVDAKTADDHPMVYTEVTLRYVLTGKNPDRNKVEKAVNLSIEKYCAVHAMLSKTAKMDHDIIINNEL